MDYTDPLQNEFIPFSGELQLASDGGRWITVNGRHVFIKDKEETDLDSISEKDAVTELQSGMFNSRVGGYTTINQHLRGGGISEGRRSVGVNEKIIDSHVSRIDSAISKHRVTEDTTLYRGVRDSKSFMGSSPKVGDVFSDASFVSTSTSKSVASRFAEKLNYGETPRVLKILVPKGNVAARVKDITGKEAGLGGSEKEYLLPRNSRFKITRVTNSATEVTLL